MTGDDIVEKARAEIKRQVIANEITATLNGCCSYQDCWVPGIEGWGENDVESFSAAEIYTGEVAELMTSFARSAVRDALGEVSKLYRERYYCTEYSDTSDDFLRAVSALRKKFEVGE